MSPSPNIAPGTGPVPPIAGGIGMPRGGPKPAVDIAADPGGIIMPGSMPAPGLTGGIMPDIMSGRIEAISGIDDIGGIMPGCLGGIGGIKPGSGAPVGGCWNGGIPGGRGIMPAAGT